MRIGRRTFARLAFTAATGGLLAACRRPAPRPPPIAGRRPDDPAVPRPSPTPLPRPERYAEAPELAEQVTRGTLSPADERLPDEPRVIAPAEGTGRYGGALRRAYAYDGVWGVSPYEFAYGATGRDLHGLAGADLAAYDERLVLMPNLCAWWQFDADATRLTVGLRRGLRWPDGAPVTAADAVYYHAHHLQGLGLAREGDPQAEALDDFTFVLRFPAPRPDYLHGATRSDPSPPLAPAHHLRGYHADLAGEDLLREMARQEGLDDWRLLYQERALAYVNPQLPVLGAWRPAPEGTEATPEPARPRSPWHRLLEREWLLLERNPYFWQVDTAGQQLPYIDRVLHSHCPSRELLRLRIVGGELDYHARSLAAGDLGWLREAEAAGGPAIHAAPSAWHLTLQPNLSARDPRLRAFLAQRPVRVALSLAIDGSRAAGRARGPALRRGHRRLAPADAPAALVGGTEASRAAGDAPRGRGVARRAGWNGSRWRSTRGCSFVCSR